MLGALGQVVQFVGIIFQIVQRHPILALAVEQFPPIIADRALIPHVSGEQVVSNFFRFAANEIRKVFALDSFRHRQRGETAQRRVNVIKVNQCIR